MTDARLQARAPSKTRVGWIGTGVMGGAMASHLLRREYGVTVYTRTKTKATGLLADGARWAESPKAVADQSEVVFTMVGYPQDVRDVYFATQACWRPQARDASWST
jgi:3-hydroxyisobutyrate dehydrogenase